jgi:hypothetical protein
VEQSIERVGAVAMSFLCEVRVRGRLSRTLANEFEQLALTASVEPVETVLSGAVEDQAALHGLLRRIESLGLELLEVRRVRAGGLAPSEQGMRAGGRPTGHEATGGD